MRNRKGRYWVGVSDFGQATLEHRKPDPDEYLYVVGPFWRRRVAENFVHLVRSAPVHAELTRRAGAAHGPTLKTDH